MGSRVAVSEIRDSSQGKRITKEVINVLHLQDVPLRSVASQAASVTANKNLKTEGDAFRKADGCIANS